jgi:hypothetical protein
VTPALVLLDLVAGGEWIQHLAPPMRDCNKGGTTPKTHFSSGSEALDQTAALI